MEINETKSVLDMDDDEFNNLPVLDIEEETVEEESSEDTESEVVDESVESTYNTENTEEDSNTDEEQESDVDDVDDTEDISEASEEVSGESDTDTPEDSETSSEEDSEDDIDYKEEFNKVLAPLKAVGKTINVESIEDLRSLAKMGMDYQRKMVAIKPYRITAKKLEVNNITDDKLDFLIDLSKGNPDAIQKLLVENKIDPLDLDLEKDTKYKPTEYTVNDKDVELDSILEDIKDTETFKTTIDIVSNKWDDSSKGMILEDPQIIKVLNDQVASGVFDQINTVVETERMMGRLEGVSDLEAYIKVGDIIQTKQGFKQKPTDEVKEVIQPKKISKPSNPKLKNRKKATTTTKANPTKIKPNYNPLSMSDEDFEKEFSNKYI